MGFLIYQATSLLLISLAAYLLKCDVVQFLCHLDRYWIHAWSIAFQLHTAMNQRRYFVKISVFSCFVRALLLKTMPGYTVVYYVEPSVL